MFSSLKVQYQPVKEKKFNIKLNIRVEASAEIPSTSNRIPTRGQYQKGSHVYFLLEVFWVILLFQQIVQLSDINVVLMSQ